MTAYESYTRAKLMVRDPSSQIDLTGLYSRDRAWVMAKRPEFSPATPMQR